MSRNKRVKDSWNHAGKFHLLLVRQLLPCACVLLVKGKFFFTRDIYMEKQVSIIRMFVVII